MFLEGFTDLYECHTDDDCFGLSTCQNDTSVYTAPFYCTGWGRPADVQVLPDGSLAVTDDLNGVVYRITYEGVPWYLSAAFLAPVIVGAVLLVGVSGVLVCRAVWRRTRYPAVDGNEPILAPEYGSIPASATDTTTAAAAAAAKV